MKNIYQAVFGSGILIDVFVEADSREEAIELAKSKLTEEEIIKRLESQDWTFTLEDIFIPNIEEIVSEQGK